MPPLPKLGPQSHFLGDSYLGLRKDADTRRAWSRKGPEAPGKLLCGVEQGDPDLLEVGGRPEGPEQALPWPWFPGLLFSS